MVKSVKDRQILYENSMETDSPLIESKLVVN